jgi:GNAT superfamily N-acetyltransferase
MPLRVHTLSPDNPSHVALIPKIAEIHLAAWLTSSLYTTIYYGPPSSHAGILQVSQQRHLGSLTTNPSSHFAVVVDDEIQPTSTDTDQENKEHLIQPSQVISFLKYDVFASREAVEARKDAGQRIWPPYTNAALVSNVWGQIVETRQRFSKQIGPHVNVDILATSPSHHRRGAGKLLMQHVVERIDDLGLTGTLEGSPDGLKLYSSLGFVPVDDIWVDILRQDGGEDKGEEWAKAEGRVPGQGEGWYKYVAMVRQAAPR